MEVATTLSNNEDVVNNIDENQNNQEAEQEEVLHQDVEESTEDTSSDETETTVDEYEKAWESIDTNNPSESLFGDTTDVTEAATEVMEDQHDEVSEVTQVDSNGLLIKNPVLKYKGREIPIDNEEEAINLMQKGFKLENEMAKIKPMKPYINILNSGNVTVEDLKAFDDAMSGNEQAKTYLAKKIGLSTNETDSNIFNEVDTSNNKEDYKPDVPAQDPVAEYFAGITEENPEVAGKVSSVYSDLEDEFKMEIYNPQVFPMFVQSVASGEFDELYPLALKERVNNPALSFLQAYQMAGQKRGQVKQKSEVPTNAVKVPKNNSSKSRTSRDSYERAFDMDTKELEAKLFG